MLGLVNFKSQQFEANVEVNRPCIKGYEQLILSWIWPLISLGSMPFTALKSPGHNFSIQLCFRLKQVYKPMDHVSKVINSLIIFLICPKSMPLTALKVAQLTPSHNTGMWLCFRWNQIHKPIDHVSKALDSLILFQVCPLIKHNSCPFVVLKSSSWLQVICLVCTLCFTLKKRYNPTDPRQRQA